jgi:hypothetical protein
MVAMPDLTPRQILGAIHEGLEESALLVALDYDPSQGRPNRSLLNNVLELRGYGRPITEQGLENTRAYDEWIRAIARAVTGRPNTPIGEVIAALKHGAASRINPN